MKIREIIIVEGKYDEVAVKKACEATVIQTGGFGLFKDKELKKFIAKIAKERGIIILTDSDRAGFTIRRCIESCVDKTFIKNAYIPTIEGKEKRKTHPSKEGSLGVEGMDSETIINALIRCGATTDGNSVPQNKRFVTKYDLYEDGLSGGENSIGEKRKLLKKLELPVNLSTKKFLEAINIFLTYDEYKELTKQMSK